MSYSNSAGLIFEETHTRGAAGRLTSTLETDSLGTRQWNYGYDLRGRLTSVEKDGLLDSAYVYDPNGNRQVVTPGNSVTAVYDDQDRLLSFGAANYTYDEHGDLLEKVEAGGSVVTKYTYDEFSNLVAVELPDGRELSYGIDARNRRVSKSVDGVLERGWVYGDQLSPIAEVDGAGAVVSRFVYGAHLHVPEYMEKDGRTYRYVTDYRGSVRALVDTLDGSVAQELQYDAWGVVLGDTSPGFQPFGYAGGLWEAETELVRFGARDYAAEVGRWTTKDPIGFDGGSTSLYEYVGQAPIQAIDPSGLVMGPTPQRQAEIASGKGPRFVRGFLDGIFSWGEIPQNIVGLVGAAGGSADLSSRFHGSWVVRGAWLPDAVGANAVGMGDFILLGSQCDPDQMDSYEHNVPVWEHERGHQMQSQEMGIFYLPVVALSYWEHYNSGHAGNPWIDVDANARARERQ